MTGPRVQLGAVALLLLAGVVAGCGGDDGDDGAAPGADPGAGAEDGPCSLLDVAEIEAVFGDVGAVADGEELGISCAWEVGDPTDPGSGLVVVTRARGAGSAEQSLAEIRDVSDDPVEVEGVGDEACLCSGGLWFRSGDITFSVTPSFGDDVPGMDEKLAALARNMLERA